jgi:hypothetical protein
MKNANAIKSSSVGIAPSSRRKEYASNAAA